MDFDFSDDQEMLRDSVRRWVERGYDFERRKKIVAAGGFSRDVWQDIADLGICGLQVPESVHADPDLFPGRRDSEERSAPRRTRSPRPPRGAAR